MSCFSLEERIKLFGVSNQLVENDLDKVEREQTIDLARGHQKTLEKDQDYYPQIERDIRQEAETMSQHYEIFYSLEKSIRRLIIATLDNVEPTGWWNTTRVPQKVFDDTNSRIQREIDSGVTRRSAEPIDFTNFGELGEIIKKNSFVISIRRRVAANQQRRERCRTVSDASVTIFKPHNIVLFEIGTGAYFN